jgi:Tfp pilus assembly protein PilP
LNVFVFQNISFAMSASRKKIFFRWNFWILISFFLSTPWAGANAEDSGKRLAAILGPDIVVENYSYITEGRPDPFKPFISEKATVPAGVDPNEIVDDGVELTGMQLFEPGQLTLVGVLLSSSGEMALVEDQARKGYVLKPGMPIGKRGVVTQIETDQVVITETARTRAGEEVKTTVVMRLNKEGDQ